MSAGVDDSDQVASGVSTEPLSPEPLSPEPLSPQPLSPQTLDRADPDPEHHHVLIEPQEDRWRWRRRIRQNPHQLRVYRVAVAIAGLFFVALGFVTGPLPGPGGIPLVLLGLAIWSSEFEWAHRLMLWFKAQLQRFRGWSRPRQVLFWVIFFVCCGAFGYAYLLVLGLPVWMPQAIDELLTRLPGV